VDSDESGQESEAGESDVTVETATYCTDANRKLLLDLSLFLFLLLSVVA